MSFPNSDPPLVEMYASLQNALREAIAMLEDSRWNEHHVQCPVGMTRSPQYEDIPDGPIGCYGCICEDAIAPLCLTLNVSLLS